MFKKIEIKLIMKISNIISFYIALLISGFFLWVFWWFFCLGFLKKNPGGFFWVGLNYDNPGSKKEIQLVYNAAPKFYLLLSQLVSVFLINYMKSLFTFLYWISFLIFIKI